MIRPPPISTLFPYTTLFRSHEARPRAVRPGPYRRAARPIGRAARSEEHTSELQSHHDLVCRLLLEKKKKKPKLKFNKKKKIQKVKTITTLTYINIIQTKYFP